jgi:5-methyltetrahydrofolate--homocysteine methyltransferase
MTRTVVESKTKTAIIGFDEPFCVIGERINPTGRKILNAELEAGDYSRRLDQSSAHGVFPAGV